MQVIYTRWLQNSLPLPEKYQQPKTTRHLAHLLTKASNPSNRQAWNVPTNVPTAANNILVEEGLQLLDSGPSFILGNPALTHVKQEWTTFVRITPRSHLKD